MKVGNTVTTLANMIKFIALILQYKTENIGITSVIENKAILKIKKV